MAISKAAGELRDELRAEGGQSYDQSMKKIGGQLIDLIRGESGQFKLITQPHGTKNWYFVSLA